MTKENMFQLLLLILAISIYMARRWHSHKTAPRRSGAQTPRLCTIIMMMWSVSLIVSASGLGGAISHLPFTDNMRWIGVICLIASFPVPVWDRLFRWIGGGITSRIAYGPAAAHMELGPHHLVLNPMFLTFAVCDVGAVLLSANSYVLAMSMVALIAMATWVKRDYPQPA